MSLLDSLFKPKTQSKEEAERSVEILERLKQRRGAETGKWLSLMQASSAPPPLPGPPPTIEDVDKRDIINEKPYTPPMAAQYTTMSVPTVQKPQQSQVPTGEPGDTEIWIQKLFAELSRQAGAYNKEHPNTPLDLIVRQAEWVYAKPAFGEAFDQHRRLEVCKGHVATLHWAMFVQGYENRIDIYMVPAEQILNFTLNDIRTSNLQPFMTITGETAGGAHSWNLSGTNIGEAHLLPLVKELLGDLIRIASGTMSEAELFGDHSAGLRLGETVAQGYDKEKASATPDQLSERVAMLATWSACDALLKALDQDLSWIMMREGAVDPAKEPEMSKRLRALSSALRELSGQVSTAMAEQKPTLNR